MRSPARCSAALRSPVGAVVGGLIVGVTENLVGTYLIASQLKLTVALALIILVLVFTAERIVRHGNRAAGVRWKSGKLTLPSARDAAPTSNAMADRRPAPGDWLGYSGARSRVAVRASVHARAIITFSN